MSECIRKTEDASERTFFDDFDSKVRLKIAKKIKIPQKIKIAKKMIEINYLFETI